MIVHVTYENNEESFNDIDDFFMRDGFLFLTNGDVQVYLNTKYIVMFKVENE